jgi:hypothetical protein
MNKIIFAAGGGFALFEIKSLYSGFKGAERAF